MEYCEAPLEGNPEPSDPETAEAIGLHARGGPGFVAFLNLQELRGVAMSLLKAWHMQAEMTKHFGAQAMGQPARIKS